MTATASAFNLNAAAIRERVRVALSQRAQLLAGPQHAETLAETVTVALMAELPGALAELFPAVSSEAAA